MKNISIRYRLGIVAVGFFLIIALMFIMTWTISEKQKDDGLVINLAGRQRMLVQKIVKETVSFNYARANAWAAATTLPTQLTWHTRRTRSKPSGR